jgi:hypothetical protein
MVFLDVSNSDTYSEWSFLDWYLSLLRNLPRVGYHFYTDFTQETSATGTDNWLAELNSWTWAGTTNWFTSMTSWQTGIARMTSWSTATWRAALASWFEAVSFGWGERFYENSVKVEALSTGTDRYALIIWFFDFNLGVNQIDGAYLLYDEWWVSTWSTASANRQYVTSAASTRTFVNSSTAVNTNFNKLCVIINAAWTSASFYVNDTLLWTTTTNIPTGSNRCGFWIQVVKSIWTTAVNISTDYIIAQAKRTTPR